MCHYIRGKLNELLVTNQKTKERGAINGNRPQQAHRTKVIPRS